jgi:hypothetical protein
MMPTPQERAQELLDLTNACLTSLVADGIVAAARLDDARVKVFHVLADYLYGNAAVDTPPLRSDHAPDHRT